MAVLLARSAALLLGLFLVELLSRLFFWFDPHLHYKVNSSAAWRIAWVARQNAGIAIYRPGIDQFDPVLGWRNRPEFRNEQPILGSRIVRTNSKGARGLREHHHALTDQRRIVVIGDSFAFGWGVSDHHTYSAQLEAALPQTEVLNLGVGGYGTDQMLLMLATEGIRYRPDLVIVGLVSADMDRNIVSFRDFAKPRFILEGESIRLKGTPVPPPHHWLSREPWRPKSADFLEVVVAAVEAKTTRRQKRAERITWALWKRIDDVAKAARADALFVFAPHGEEIWQDEPGAGEKLAVRFAESEGARLLNLGEDFRRRRRAGELFAQGHWGEREHALIARAVKDRLVADEGEGSQGVAAER